MRDVWARQVPCEAVAVDDKIVAAIGGGVICCDLLGQVRWSRRQTWVPPAADQDRTEQHLALPLVDEGRVYVTQPGVAHRAMRRSDQRPAAMATGAA